MGESGDEGWVVVGMRRGVRVGMRGRVRVGIRSGWVWGYGVGRGGNEGWGEGCSGVGIRGVWGGNE